MEVLALGPIYDSYSKVPLLNLCLKRKHDM